MKSQLGIARDLNVSSSCKKQKMSRILSNFCPIPHRMPCNLERKNIDIKKNFFCYYWLVEIKFFNVKTFFKLIFLNVIEKFSYFSKITKDCHVWTSEEKMRKKPSNFLAVHFLIFSGFFHIRCYIPSSILDIWKIGTVMSSVDLRL